MIATYTRLNNGEWGVRVRGEKPKADDWVTVTKRSGETRDELVGAVLWSGEDVHLCTVKRDDGTARVPTGEVTSASPLPRPTYEDGLPFVLQDRKLFELSSPKGALSKHKLTDVEERLGEIRRLQQPTDVIQSLNKLHVDFNGGYMDAGFTEPTNGSTHGRVYLVGHTAASQLAREVLPSRFFPGLRHLVKMDGQGAELGTKVWNKFATKAMKPRMVRTLRANVNKQPRWVVRSCHSTKYAPYDNLELVQDILSYAKDFATMPVISCWVSDGGMRIRFFALDAGTAAFMHMDEGALINQPIPMIEVWNSEVGRRSVGMKAGMYRVVSSTGLTCWSDRTEFAWAHRGKSTRISLGVKNAFGDLVETANEVIKVYTQAMSIQIDDPEAYLLAAAQKNGASDTTLTAAKKALKDPTITAGSVLARVVDAIALAARDYDDLYTQEDVEKIASQVLIQGHRRWEQLPSVTLKAEEV